MKRAYASPPSRATNPFATCWHRPGALPYLDSPGAAPDVVLRRLNELRSPNRGAALLGPHGCGKSTLLVELGEQLAAMGHRVQRTNALHEELPTALVRDSYWLVEGAERLGTWPLRQLGKLAYRNRVQLVATLHSRLAARWARFSIAVELKPSEQIALGAFRYLMRNEPPPWVVSETDLCQTFAKQQGDLRATWFELYQLYETRRRTAVATATNASEHARTSEPLPA